MKTKLIILLTLLSTIIVLAATLTIDIPAADVPRVSEAFGSILNLGRNATVQEVEYATRQWLIQQTKDYERRRNQQTYTPPPLEMQPSPTPTTTPGMAAAIRTVPSPTAKPKK